MGLTHSSNLGDMCVASSAGEKIIALAGNPNVGKSTIFNALTGLNQHTGNWPGKTVGIAVGSLQTEKYACRLVDVPGAYSLLAHSPEEEVARDFICFGANGVVPDVVVVVCDATCLERNLNLVLQTIEVGRPVVVCVNLLDEAAKKGITIDLERLQRELGVRVVGVTAREEGTLSVLTAALDEVLDEVLDKVSCADYQPMCCTPVPYPAELADSCARLAGLLPALLGVSREIMPNPNWLALRLLEGEPSMLRQIERAFGVNLAENQGLQVTLGWAEQLLAVAGISLNELSDTVVGALVARAEEIAVAVCRTEGKGRCMDDWLDRILTGRYTAYPIMLLLLLVVFWLTIVGANYPSEALSTLFSRLGVWLEEGLRGLPPWLHGLLLNGVYKTVSWVVSVMLPPMAIFFPLFTLLEDVGYLPRVAYNLDKPFARCHACGKQALTICLEFCMGAIWCASLS